MWLLYVTFEDFICLSYPTKSAAVLSTRVDINNYINTGPISAKRRKSNKRHRDSPDKAIEETCEENRLKHNLGDEHLNQNELGLRIGEVICVHQIARKRRLGRSVSDNTPSDNSSNCVHGVNDLNSLGLDNIDMPYRDRDRMHERRKKDQRSNVTLTKDYGFGNSWRTRQSGDIIRNCHLTDQLVNHNGCEQNPRNKNLPDNRKELSGATGNSDLTRSVSFDNVITPEKEMPSKTLSCESSPVTISSGYESDSLPTNEADIDNIFVNGKKKQNNRPVPPMELPIDYFSMSDSHPSPHGQSICTSAIVTRKPETFVQNELNEQSQQNKSITEETGPPVQTHQEQTDNQTPTRFSPAQINNYQLTKVARSMFEIIHDLQAEKDQENKMKSRKLKRHVQWRKDRPDVLRKPVKNIENESGVSTSVSQQENCEQSRENFQPALLSSQGKVSVRCVRRPLGSDPSFQNRQYLPHSSEFDKTSYPEFSRQLSEPEIRSHDIHSEKFHMNHSFDSRDKRNHIVFEGCAPYATTKLPGCSPYATTRLPGCQTPRRDEKDDHVYETIPGDDLLQYEEILRMRLNGLLPHKYHPPALPARNINDRKMSEPIRTDFNANFRLQQQRIQSNPNFQQNLQNDINIISTSSNHRNHQVSKPRSFSYDPSDPSKTVPNEFVSRWSAADLLNYIDGIRQPPPKRRENFYFLLDSKQKRACFSESLEIENKIKDMGINLDESRRPHQDEDGYTTVDNDPSEAPPFCTGGLHNMQSTYV
ncbi:Hypothetical predicted protein [Mytilus galloprovincialis]|uniref:Uncharacterized protein n=1 Tax=Mytilus galloprovincialis TaxID=29158 RepID=A0A8B6GT95_MYTGA|nr:Hypothetical predicted protein [Mytilus galloprovincialis]